MPTKPDGALGSLDYTKEERRALAIKSRLSAPRFGNTERQALIDEVCCLSTCRHIYPQKEPSSLYLHLF